MRPRRPDWDEPRRNEIMAMLSKANAELQELRDWSLSQEDRELALEVLPDVESAERKMERRERGRK